MLRLFSARVAVVLVVLVASASALAQPVYLMANLTNAGEPGGVIPTTSQPGGGPRPASFGTALFVLDSRTNPTQMTMSAVINNIDINGTQTPNEANDNLTAAHIHAGATIVPTASVVWGFHGTPQNNINPPDGAVIPTPGGVGGTFLATWNAPEGNGGTTLNAQLSNILNQRSYLNFHTSQFGGGEIRGTLVEVPEPSTLALGLGSIGVLALRRRR